MSIFKKGHIPHNKHPAKFKECDFCKIIFEIPRRNPKTRFCSHKCSTDSMKGIPKGIEHRKNISKNHKRYWANHKMTSEHKEKSTRHFFGNKYAYKDGSTPEQKRIRNSREMLLWKKLIYARDGYRCVICSSNKEINAHHIKSFAKYPEYRFALSNGITLCHICHKEVHRSMKAQASGCVPVTTDYAALAETVKIGIKVKGKAGDNNEEFKKSLIEILKSDERQEVLREELLKNKNMFSWELVAKQWQNQLFVSAKVDLVELLSAKAQSV